jgi:hypothetical protein
VDTSRLDQFEHIWVGAKNKVLWQFHRADASDLDVPGTIKDDMTITRLFAVAVDHDGTTWVKKINRELLSDSADPKMINAGQPLPITCSDDLMALLLDDFKSALAPAGNMIDLPVPTGSAERRQLLQSVELRSPSIEMLNDNQWHQLTDKLKQDGSLADQLPSIRMQLAPNDGTFDLQTNDPRFVHLVPEPAGAATMLLVSAALLAKRRRKVP